MALMACDLPDAAAQASDARDDARAIGDPVFEARGAGGGVARRGVRPRDRDAAARLDESAAALERLSAEQLATRLPAFWMHGRARRALGQFDGGARRPASGAPRSRRTRVASASRLVLVVESVPTLVELGRLRRGDRGGRGRPRARAPRGNPRMLAVGARACWRRRAWRPATSPPRCATRARPRRRRRGRLPRRRPARLGARRGARSPRAMPTGPSPRCAGAFGPGLARRPARRPAGGGGRPRRGAARRRRPRRGRGRARARRAGGGRARDALGRGRHPARAQRPAAGARRGRTTPSAAAAAAREAADGAAARRGPRPARRGPCARRGGRARGRGRRPARRRERAARVRRASACATRPPGSCGASGIASCARAEATRTAAP